MSFNLSEMSNVLVSWVPFFAISAGFALLYALIFRYLLKRKVSWISILIGAIGVSLGALFLEEFLYQYYADLFISLVFVAPLVEESLKLIGSSYGRKIENGMGIGLGFATTENALYFHSFLAYPLFLMLIFVSARGILDPLFHAFTGGLDSKSWKGGKSVLWVLASMGIHSSYNFAALLLASLPVPYYYIIPSVEVVLLVLVAWALLREKDTESEVQEVHNEIEKAVRKEEEPKINYSSFSELARSAGKITQKYGFEKVAKIFGFTNEYERTRWLRTAVLKDYARGRSEIYIEMGIFGILAFTAIGIAAGYTIWFLFFS